MPEICEMCKKRAIYGYEESLLPKMDQYFYEKFDFL